MDFYDKLLLHKQRQKIGYKAIGDIIDLKPDAIRMAIERRSLTRLQMSEIEKYFDFVNIFNTIDEVSTFKESAAAYKKMSKLEKAQQNIIDLQNEKIIDLERRLKECEQQNFFKKSKVQR